MLKDPSDRLRRAIQENNLYLVRRIIERNVEGKGIPSARRSRPYRFDFRNPDPQASRYTSLAWAAVYGHEEIFEYLLNLGHDEEELSRDVENNTILILLAGVRGPPENSIQGKDYDLQDTALRMAQMYYERYPYLIDWSNVHGKTAMHVAATKGNEGFVRMFCDLGADFDLPDLQGNTPLHHASAWNHVSVLQLLIERGCQYAARNNEGFTASDYAFSFSTMNTLQETARSQFENNKKARRHIFAQAAARGGERERREGPGSSSQRGDRSPEEEFKRPARIDPDSMQRLRSGSGGSRTTMTSNSEGEASGSGGTPSSAMSHVKVGMPPPASVSAFSNATTSNSGLQLGLHVGHGTPRLNATSSASISHGAPAPKFPTSNGLPSSTFSSQLNPTTTLITPSTPSAPGISPVASRMRERDADAMAEYMRRNRSGSNPNSSSVDMRVGPPGSTSGALTYSGSPSHPSQAPPPPSSPPVDKHPARNRSRDSARAADSNGTDREEERGASNRTEFLENPVLRPLRRLRSSNSSASLRPTGIIGVPGAAHGHSHSAVDVDKISEALSSMKAGTGGAGGGDGGGNGSSGYHPHAPPPASGVTQPILGTTKPLAIKPRQKSAPLENNSQLQQQSHHAGQSLGMASTISDLPLPPLPTAPAPAPPSQGFGDTSQIPARNMGRRL
ncbi:hypothetical protein FRB97_009126 [Tulasnella sp. 331]|nr:hypothetical protein FRB97_009126 [Tulasnella sp. 331]